MQGVSKDIVHWTFLLSVWVIALCPGRAVMAQFDAYHEAYYPVAAKSYGISDGMPDRCVEHVFTDTLGRLNLIPCSYVQSNQGMYLYQFDGFRSYQLDVPIKGGVGRWSIVPCHIGKDGLLYGYLLNDSGKDSTYTLGFIYKPDAGSWKIIHPPPQNGEQAFIRGVSSHEDQLFFLLQQGENMRIYRYATAAWEYITEMPAESQRGNLQWNIAFQVDDNFYYTEEMNGTIHRIQRASLQQTRVKIPDALTSQTTQRNYFITLPNGTKLSKGNHSGTLYKPDFEREGVEVYLPSGSPAPNGREALHYAFQDRSGNVLFVSFDSEQNCSGYLLSPDGESSDYSDVLHKLSGIDDEGLRHYDLVSDDFSRTLFVTGREFMVIEVAPKGAIESVETLPVRGIIELSDSLFVFPRGLVYAGSTIFADESNTPACFRTLQFDGDIVRRDSQYFYHLRTKGLFSYDLSTQTCKLLFANPRIQRIAAGPGERLYLLAENKLYSFDLSSQSASLLMDTTMSAFVNEIFVTRDDRVYLATSDGLVFVNRKKRVLETVRCGSMPLSGPVLSVYEDQQGRFWAGTHSGGLIIYDPKSQSCKTLGVEDGLSSNIIASTIEDQSGDIWVGTYNGITIFDQEAEILGYVFKESGLVDNECNRWAADMLRDGRLFFGTPQGFSLIHADAVKQQISATRPPRIYPTTLEFDGMRHDIGDTLFHQILKDGVRIPAGNRSLRISYGLSTYASAQSSRFAYKLDLPEQEWNFVGQLHSLSLSNLPPGEYSILLKGTDFRGRESANTLSIPMHVGQYFYKTVTFFLLCMLTAGSLIVLWMRRQRSEQKRLEREVQRRTETIREQTEELREIDQQKTRLYTNITHEFRTPLTIIRGLIDKVDEDEKAPELIRRNADTLLNLVNQMLELRKLEAGNLKLQPVQGNIIPYLQYVGESFRSLAEAKSLRYHFLSEETEVLMDYDPNKLARIIANLLSNAIKFTPPGGDIYLQVDNSGLDEGLLILKVIDNGIGIPENLQQKIFERFYQVDDSHIRKGEGTGIGLTLVAEFVKLMQGEIRVTSGSGKGTTFTLTLPVSNDAEFEGEKNAYSLHQGLTGGLHHTETMHASDFEGGKADYRVLIVEDNPDVVHYIGGCLKDRYSLMIAMDGQEGVEKALEQIPDLIISDVMMPIKDGFDLCEELKNDERTSHIPIILLTAKADAASRLEGLTRGADAYLAKPFDKEELLVRLSGLIRQREKLQSRYAGNTVPFASTDDPDVQIEDAFIAKVNASIQTHLSEEGFGIDELCSSLNLGRTNLYNKLKALTGMSTAIYIRTFRINASLRFLEDPELNVSEAAYAVGFSDPKYFTRIFRQQFNLSPSEWKERAMAGKTSGVD